LGLQAEQLLGSGMMGQFGGFGDIWSSTGGLTGTLPTQQQTAYADTMQQILNNYYTQGGFNTPVNF